LSVFVKIGKQVGCAMFLCDMVICYCMYQYLFSDIKAVPLLVNLLSF